MPWFKSPMMDGTVSGNWAGRDRGPSAESVKSYLSLFPRKIHIQTHLSKSRNSGSSKEIQTFCGFSSENKRQKTFITYSAACQVRRRI